MLQSVMLAIGIPYFCKLLTVKITINIIFERYNKLKFTVNIYVFLIQICKKIISTHYAINTMNATQQAQQSFKNKIHERILQLQSP